MLQATLENEGKDRITEAVAYLNNPMLHNYIEKFGFVVCGADPDYKGSGEMFLLMRRDEKERTQLKGPALTKEEIILAVLGRKENRGFEVRQYDLQNEEEFKNDLLVRLRGGSLLTRFYLANKNTAYVVFEKPPVLKAS